MRCSGDSNRLVIVSVTVLYVSCFLVATVSARHHFLKKTGEELEESQYKVPVLREQALLSLPITEMSNNPLPRTR